MKILILAMMATGFFAGYAHGAEAAPIAARTLQPPTPMTSGRVCCTRCGGRYQPEGGPEGDCPGVNSDCLVRCLNE